MSVTAERSATVLLVEDDLDVVALVEAVVARGSHSLQLAAVCRDGTEAVRRARELQPDVVLLDLGLPGGDGLAVLQALRRVCPGAAVVVHSAYVDLYADHLVTADAVIRKGAGILELPRRLAEAAARKGHEQVHPER